MSAPVDVLAVYDDCIAKLEYHYRGTRAGDEMREARAAVAELIAAAAEVEKDLPLLHVTRLRAALARVGGDG